MNHRPIIDAGPGLNFLAINRERLLIGVLGKLSAPEAVEREVLDKAGRDRRFRTAEKTWRKLTPHGWMRILSDDTTPELAAVVDRITGTSMAARSKEPKDLGEIMVVAHAVVAAESGATVIVLIDDGQGARIADAEIRRLDRLRSSGRSVGRMGLVSTVTVLERAAGKHIADRAEMRSVYEQLRGIDDGLLPIDATGLLSRGLWSPDPPP
ncbi:hypothetical protein [Streptomonospora salina]|uniref:Uncharacterized protein n=1 Tax=Streptomonospora salina TaxID=104205 RepID=A0A841E9Q9_9ACTN|nr:hypothetical protein [Streptomonospora salina]MBB5999746.1 hypothetical protein [Streptomonospora salina]